MLIDRIKDDMKAAMRAKERARLGTIRLILAAFKQYEVDERKEVRDEVALTLMGKMLKQRRDSIEQYERAGREDLAAIEHAEVAVIQQYMPEPLGEDELTTLVEQAIAASAASSIRDMGKVMGVLKTQIQGRADMGAVGALVKTQLT